MPIPETVDIEPLAEGVLAFLALASFTDPGAIRAWKGLDGDVLELLHEPGWIRNPKGKARSVVLTEAGHPLERASIGEAIRQR